MLQDRANVGNSKLWASIMCYACAIRVPVLHVRRTDRHVPLSPPKAERSKAVWC